MKCLDQKLPFPLFDVDETDGAERNASARIKGMNQFVFALARLQLVLEHPKHIRRDMLQLKLRVIGHALFAIHLLDILAFEV